MFNLQGRLCRNFGRKSRALNNIWGKEVIVSVSGPDIGVMSGIPQDSSRVPRNSGRVLSVSPKQYFNLPRQQKVKFADQLKESVRLVVQEETLKMEARSREESLKMEARTKQLVEAERENLLSQLSKLIPNFDQSMLKLNTMSQIQGQSPKNPMSDKASCSGALDVRALQFEEDTAKNGEKQEEMKSGEVEKTVEGKILEIVEQKSGDVEKIVENIEEKKDEMKSGDVEKIEEKKDEKQSSVGEEKIEKSTEVPDYSKLELPSSLQSLCSYVESTLKPQEKAMSFTIEKEVFGIDRNTFVLHEDITQFAGMEEIGATVVAVYMRCLFDHLKAANMVNMVGFIDPAAVSADAGSLTDRSRLVANRLQKTDGEQIFLMPYNPSRHWVLIIVRAKKETVYFLDPLPGNRVVDEDGKNIVNSALKMYNTHIGRVGRKTPLWKTLPGTPKQPSSVECGYYVMRFMRDIIKDTSLEFEKTFAKGKNQKPYPQAAIEEVRKEWAEFVCVHME